MTSELSTELKSTVNLPRTDFAQKGNLPQNEPVRLARWTEVDLYARLREARAGRPVFVLHDGPPYANGRIHLGHVLNKVLKDFCVKSRSMMGFWAPYVPGWDCHGLPIEIKVEEELGAHKNDMPVVEVRRAARRHAEKYLALQREDFKRLGILGEWDNPYQTMNFRYQAEIVRVFAEFVRRDAVYKGMRPVHWCISCQTALAEAEVEYKDHTSYSVYVRFQFPDAEKLDSELAGRSVSIVIWTTTPWTLPANLAISFNPGFEYSAVEVGAEVFIVASGLLEAVATKVGWAERGYRVIGTYRGEQFDRLRARHPFIDRDSLILLGDHVTLDAGTGAVHTAPGHGYEDYVIGRQYGLEVYNPVDNRGYFVREVEHFAGQRVIALTKADAANDGNRSVIAHLESIGALLRQEKFQHQYPHCWRCHHPVIFRATPQWFISMSGSGLNQRAIEACDQVQWVPGWGNERMKNMFRDRPDWCISRQRAWGVPIPVFYCEECEESLCDPAVIDGIADIFATESADAWYTREIDQLLPAGTRCGKCGSERFRREKDILDVWFDSGSSSIAVLKAYDLPYPADVYLEGGDQFRGWFNSSLVVGLAVRGTPPYRTVITNGWAVDGNGEKMSKSKGNVVEPEKVIRLMGAEILRLWCSALDYHEDMRVSDEILKRISDAYRKLRNTARYCLGNLDGFNPEKDRVDYREMMEIDRWALAQIDLVTRRVLAAYERYDFTEVYQSLYSYATIELSSLYFDILKDRLYTSAPKSVARRSAQTALFEIVHRLTRLMAPILAFTADEIWEHIPGVKNESVHLTVFPAAEDGWRDEALLERYARLFELRGIVTKALEEARAARLIGSPLEAKVTVATDAGTREFLASFGEDLRFMFLVSAVTLVDGAGTVVTVEPADGLKCERCWNYTVDVGTDQRYPAACARCIVSLDEARSS